LDAALFAFVTFAVFLVKLTGPWFILFPPLVAIGFETLRDTTDCPWANRPLSLPVACFFDRGGGLACFKLMGESPITARCAMLWGILVLRALDLHVPPAFAVARDELGYRDTVNVAMVSAYQQFVVTFVQGSASNRLINGDASLRPGLTGR
jgi:hypothetical protein